MRPSRIIKAVQTPIIPVVGEWIRNSPGTLSLGQGMVSYPPPASARQAIRHFGERPENHWYGSALGHPRLLELITEKLRLENQINCGNVFY
jgi:aspartate/methionine/tyrosine aminotransferase